MTVATLLLVDDETAFVQAMAKRLTKRNYCVHTANSGDEALKKLENHVEIEVVILDMKMPEKDGLTVLRDIKQKHGLVEVIMLTGHGTVDTAIEGIQQGAYDYLMKPCSIDILTAKIKQATMLKHKHETEETEDRIQELTRRIA